MAASTFSLLFRYLSHHPKPHHHHRYRHRHFLSPLINHFSTSSSSSSNAPKPSSLSSRLSFVFDKIDEIESERAEKDEALQRIRAWRESKKKPNHPQQQKQQQQQQGGVVDDDDNDDDNGGVSTSDYSANNAENGKLGLGFDGGEGKELREVKKVGGLMKREIELAHPWPEWVALMERLIKQNYFDHRRKDEDQMLHNLGEVDVDVDVEGFAEEEGFDFTRDWNTVQNAVVNFGKDRFDIFRSLSRQDIQTFVGYGCPSTDKKVVFSAKLLRKHAHLDEGDVCSNCSLRTNCERAYLVTNKEDEARTIDVMRVLLTYGFDPINGSVENKSLLKNKSVKAVVRRLLHEVVRLSAVPIDPNLPPPVIKKRPPKVKQPPPPPKRRVGRDDIEMKKGDWLCPKCNFMNFAKNSVCLQCDAKRPKRQLLPGEWECPQCNFLNYRRNMTCFNCEHKRPPDEYMENQMQVRQQRPVTRLERVPNREQVSNAWNFDFDDDESDGADVAAFEYADARAMNEDHHLDSAPDKGTFSRPQDSLYGVSRTSRFPEKEPPRPLQTKQSMGFDDFDDDDDDVDSYELDNQNRNQRHEASPLRFSDVENEGYSDAESDNDFPRFGGTKSNSFPKSSRSLHQNKPLPDSGDDDLDYDSDEDFPVHPKWKSSHVAESGRRNKNTRSTSKKMSFGSDDDDDDDRLVFGSDDDVEEGFNPRRRRENYYDSDDRNLRQGDKLNQNRKQNRFEGGQVGNIVKGDDFDDEFGRSSRGSRGGDRRNFVKGDDFDDEFGRSSRGSRGGHRRNFVKDDDFDDEFGRSSRGSRGGHRGTYDNTRGRQSMGGGSRGSQRGRFDSARGRQRTSEDPHGSQRGKFGNSRERQSLSEDSRGSQRNRFNTERGRQSMGGKQRDMKNFSGPRQSRAGNRGGRSNESDNWSEHDRPLRQR